MTPEDLDRRLPVWEAMSDFFLDTEVDEATFKYIARVVVEANIDPDEARVILWNELFPVLQSNLIHPAEVWAGFSREWLRENIKPASGVGPIHGESGTVEEIKRCWSEVCKFLPPSYA